MKVVANSLAEKARRNASIVAIVLSVLAIVAILWQRRPVSYESVDVIARRTIAAINGGDSLWLARHTAPEFVALGCIESDHSVRRIFDVALADRPFTLLDDYFILGDEKQEVVPIIVPVALPDSTTGEFAIQLQRSPEGWRVDTVLHAIHWCILTDDQIERYFESFTAEHYIMFAEAFRSRSSELEVMGVRCLVRNIGLYAEIQGFDDWVKFLERKAEFQLSSPR